MKKYYTSMVLGLTAVLMASFASAQTCPGDNPVLPLYEKGVLSLDFNPAFLHVDKYTDENGVTADGLTISSFFNVAINTDPNVPSPFIPFAADQVARIKNLATLDIDSFDAATDVQRLTDTAFPPAGPPKTVWPNEAVVAPEGVFPFQALVIPQGFLSTPFPGRLTAINLDDPSFPEYVIHQSTKDWSGQSPVHSEGNSPRFYHRALFIDMDGDGLKDIVTARSGFLPGATTYPPFSELVWFRNPGELIDPATPWQETVLFGGPAPEVGFMGPDISLTAHDFEGDGVPEIVATHFFSTTDPTHLNGKIAIYGAPVGGTWADVNASFFMMPRVAQINADQGLPFDVTMVDLNNDGLKDILATNHQPDNCTRMTSSPVDGRVLAFEQPANGDVFGSPWTMHVLKDGIYPQPSLPPINPPGRMAPGHAVPFHPVKGFRHFMKPSLLVSGDEAGKVWVLEPVAPFDSSNWEYSSAVIFDINEYYTTQYGTPTTQTPMMDPFGITISTIGAPAVRYDRPGVFGRAEFYVPVFEAKEIHVFSYRPAADGNDETVICSPDETLPCGQ